MTAVWWKIAVTILLNTSVSVRPMTMSNLTFKYMASFLKKRRELRKKRFEPEGSEKYKKVNNNIKRCMKKAKENWIGEYC